MGFGILFFGYFIAEMMSLHSLGFVARLCGYALISVAARRLMRYERAFRATFFAAILMSAIAMLMTVAGLSNILYDNFIISGPLFGEMVTGVLEHIDSIMSLAFHFTLLYAIRRISLVAEVESTSYGAARNFVFLVIYYVLLYVSYLPFDFTEDYVKYFSLPVLLLYFACIILNLVLIFKCYANICDESDVDMPRKPSRFAFINKLREERDRRETRAIESTEEYVKRKKEERELRKSERRGKGK